MDPRREDEQAVTRPHTQSTLYGIWQNGGPGSPNYTLAGGSAAHGSSPSGAQRAFLMNYNERTGRFGKPRFYSYGNAPALVTHFDGITAVPGGFNLVAISSAQASSLAFIPATGSNWPLFGKATWYPIDVAASPLCTAPPAASCNRRRRPVGRLTGMPSTASQRPADAH